MQKMQNLLWGSIFLENDFNKFYWYKLLCDFNIFVVAMAGQKVKNKKKLFVLEIRVSN